jgi:polysaccharide biosynthesis/export protein
MQGFRGLTMLCVCGFLAACNAPRGAGFQTEILAASEAATIDTDAQYDFVVEVVTRDRLALLQSWPHVRGGLGHQWLSRSGALGASTISPGDLVSMVIWDAADNSLLVGAGQRATELNNLEVAPNGEIFLPFVGNVMISGLTVAAARTKIERELLSSSGSAQVQLQMTPGQGKMVNLVSGVASPGRYPLPDRNYTILSLLSEGGGVNAGLVNPQVQLFRGEQTYAISVAKLFESPRLDTTLRGRDRIIVAEDDRVFLSLGATDTQSQHVFPEDQISALDALAIIGGIAEDRANAQGILILRSYPNSAVGPNGPSKSWVVFTLDLTTADGLFSAKSFEIMPDDLIYGTESPVTSIRTILALFRSVLAAASAL